MPSSNSDSELDLAPDSEGWNDVEEDAEEVALQCLFCTCVFPDLRAFISHLSAEHEFDLLALRKQHGLDFYGLIKLVNYIRSTVKAGMTPNTSDPKEWSHDRYLQPALENDAVLFSLDELDTLESGKQPVVSNEPKDVIASLKQQLADLQLQFDAYREQVSETLDKRWQSNEETAKKPAEDVYDNQYFEGYAMNDIHQTMLQDTVRTDSYRDFIYDNKHLFKDKIVMDVGCGTGILSMFCARAGARKVIAVDNSAIIDKARQIVADNNLLDRISFVKRKVEEIDVLPDNLPHVDIIVSEWMGYCLFFEAMLPSVLVARDRFLRRTADGKTFDGLIVPSHCSLQLAPMHDPEWMTGNVSYWHDVYGFDMRCMLRKSFDDVVVRFPPQETGFALANGKQDLKVWDLYETKVEDLHFSSDFEFIVAKDVDSLDGWCIWFDIGFSPTKPPLAAVESIIDLRMNTPGTITFTTGPHGKRTHWQTGVCVIKPGETKKLKVDSTITGQLVYKKGEESRALEIEITWNLESGGNATQLWKMR